VGKPAYLCALEVGTFLVEKVEIILKAGEHFRSHYRMTVQLTFSFFTLDTAEGLLGSTPE